MIDLHNPFKGMPKPAVYATIAGTVGIGGYMVIRHHKSTGSWNPWSSGTASSGSGGVDPVTGLAYSQDNVTDPITGQTYLGEAQQYGSVQAAESAVGSYGQSSPSGSGIGVQPAVPGQDGTSNPAPGSSGSATYTSNAAWAQAATAGLAEIGYNETEVATALGEYINQVPVSPDQAKLINVARAEYGNPPIGNLQVILLPPTTPGPTTSNTTPSISNGHIVSTSQNDATVGWTGTNAVKYTTEITGPGKINGKRGTVTVPQAVYSGLEAGHNYTVTITPYNSAGKSGASGHIDFKTTAPTAARLPA